MRALLKRRIRARSASGIERERECDFDEKIEVFCKRKSMSDFSLEMTCCAREYSKSFGIETFPTRKVRLRVKNIAMNSRNSWYEK